MVGRTLKNKNAQKGVAHRATDPYHLKGLQRFDPDSKASKVVNVRTGDEQDESGLASSSTIVSSVMEGPTILSSDFGKLITGDIGLAQVHTNDLLGAAINIGLTGLLINMASSAPGTAKEGYLVSATAQFIYGVIFAQ